MTQDTHGHPGPRLDRRCMLVSAIAVLTGLAVPHRAIAGDTAMTMEKARAVIGNRYKDFGFDGNKPPMTANDMHDFVTGNTIYGVLHDDEAYVLAFHPQGRGVLKIEKRPVELGNWWIDASNQTIHSRWSHAARREVISKSYLPTEEPGLVKAVTDLSRETDGSQSWTKQGMFILQPGLHLTPPS